MAIEIQKTGSYFKIGEEGYLVNPTSHEKLQNRWKPAIDDVVELYKKTFGDKLKNVYIRGSAAKGKAIEGISDLDTFAYVYLEENEFPKGWTKDFREIFKQKYPFINGLDVRLKPVSTESQGAVLLHQSLCVFGEPTIPKKLKIGRELILHAPKLQKRFDMFYEFKKNIIEEEIPEECTWQMKGILRTGLELVIERSGKYSRDLYPCYELFSEYYPEKEPEMKEVLYLALNPTDNINKIEEVITGIGAWLVQELESVLGIKQNT